MAGGLWGPALRHILHELLSSSLPIHGPAGYVDIQNTGSQAQDLTGWVLISEKGNHHAPGYYRDPVKECTCAAATITRYQKCISGSLLNSSAQPPRGIDRHRDIEVPRFEYEKLAGDRMGEPSTATRRGCPGRGGL